MENLSKRLRRLRLKEGLSQKEVALRAKIAPSTYRDWEYGKQIKGEPYETLAKILNVSLTELLTGSHPSASRLLHEIREMEQIVENMRKIVASV